VQGAGRHLRQLRLPQIPAPVLRERRGVGAQGECECDRGVVGRQGAARARGPGAAPAQLAPGQGVRGDRIVDAQPRARHPRLEHMWVYFVVCCIEF
jgi:hypothetical protein